MTLLLPKTKSDLTSSSSSLLSKRAWEPSGLELAVLQNLSEKDGPLLKEDKGQLLMKLKNSFGTDCTIQQLDDWFQTERSRNLKRVKTEVFNSSYIKFNIIDLKFLTDSFELNNYPENEEMKSIADSLGVKFSKIENWYKHHRRSLSKRGEFDLKTKKHFNKNEINYLMSDFRKNSRPSQEEISAIAKGINCTELQIKNWFSNKRKKLRYFDEPQMFEKTDIIIQSESLNPSDQIDFFPQENNSYQEGNFSLPYGSTTCFSANSLNFGPENSKFSQQHQPPMIDSGSFLRDSIPSTSTPQELRPSHLQFKELINGSGSLDIPSQNSCRQLMSQTPSSTHQAVTNNQMSYLILIQAPVGSNLSGFYQDIFPTNFQPQPQLLLNGQRGTLAPLFINSLQSFNNHSNILFGAQRTNLQALLLNDLMTENGFVQFHQR